MDSHSPDHLPTAGSITQLDTAYILSGLFHFCSFLGRKSKIYFGRPLALIDISLPDGCGYVNVPFTLECW